MDSFEEYQKNLQLKLKNKISSTFDGISDKIHKVSLKNLDEKMWNKAKKIDTLESYLKYMEKYPNGDYIDICKQRYTKKEELIPLIKWINSYNVFFINEDIGNYNDRLSFMENLRNSSINIEIDSERILVNTLIIVEDKFITEIPNEIDKITQLDKIIINFSVPIIFPSSMRNLTNLIELEINDSGEIPTSICNLPYLEKISFSDKKISTIPDCISELKNLREFFIGENSLIDIPKSIKKLVPLKPTNTKNSVYYQLKK